MKIIASYIIVFLGISFSIAQTASERALISSKSSSHKYTTSNLSILQKKSQHTSLLQEMKSRGYEEFVIDKETGQVSQLVGKTTYGAPLYIQSEYNNDVVVGTLSSALQDGFDGYDLKGEDMVIALFESGQPRPLHELLRASENTSRITYHDIASIPTIMRHPTHVAGTLIGNQQNATTASPDNELVRGVAYEATIEAWDWLNVVDDLATAAHSGLLVGNTSFGYNPIYLHEVEFGRYSPTSQGWDEIMCANPYFQIIKSAGNTRDDNSAIVPQVTEKGGFDLLEGGGVSKNVLVIGSGDMVSAASEGILYIEEAYSNWGPTDDGRIKPDLVSHGHAVTSSIETMNNAYGLYNGTSMAAAGATGVITLLQEYWNEKFSSLYITSEVPYMWSSTTRALLIHSAEDVGVEGPDYQSGWGVLNAERAAELIRSRGETVVIREETLTENEDFILNISASGLEDLEVTLAWTDPAGNTDLITGDPSSFIDNPTADLINDLDVRIERLDSDGNISELLDSNGNNLYDPWVRLTNGIVPNIPTLSEAAGRGDNTVDNVENIVVPQEYIPENGGIYRIRVSHKDELTTACNLEEGQNFSLIISGVSICNDDLIFYQHQDDVPTATNGVHVRANTITASNIIEPSIDSSTDIDFVEYEAKEYIELVPQDTEGFTAEYGADFLAHIDCSSEFERREAFSTREYKSLLNSLAVEESYLLNSEQEFLVYPNPILNEIVNIEFSLSQNSRVQIEVFDLSGSLIMDVSPSKEYTAGQYKEIIDLLNLSNGVYILRFTSNEGVRNVKMIKK